LIVFDCFWLFVFDRNNIDDVKRLVENNQYKDELSDEEAFVFGCKLDDGTDKDHFQLGITSHKLLSRLKEGQLFHLDATYKIIKYFYLVILFGSTDINRVFFPICFIITSHEKTSNFIHFFESLNAIAQKCLDFGFQPRFIVTDACKAMNKAISKIYKECTNLMCWFHLKYNVRKRIHLVPKDLQKQVYSDIK
jgi:hypothetical protein